MDSDTLTQTEKKADTDYSVPAEEQSCHGAGNEDGHSRGRGLGHMAMMLLCCAAPIVLLSVLPLLANVSPAIGAILPKVALFLCPLMMIFMIPMMMKGHKHKDRTR